MRNRHVSIKVAETANVGVEGRLNIADAGDRPASVITDNEYNIKYLFHATKNHVLSL